jgi:hypothetical protein
MFTDVLSTSYMQRLLVNMLVCISYARSREGDLKGSGIGAVTSIVVLTLLSVIVLLMQGCIRLLSIW